MCTKSLARNIYALASRFRQANRGNVAVIFAIALVPILTFIGAAIDYTRANSARSAMQSALDSTALMVAKDYNNGLITASQINSTAQTYFHALYTNIDASGISVSAVYAAATGTSNATILINGSGTVATDFMKVVGYPIINFNTSSTTTWGNTRLRVAMALDNTGSMAQDGKMPAMQTAAKSLVDQLSVLAKSSGDVYISVVPFAKDVNIGSSNYGANWIDWTDWSAEDTDLPKTNWTLVGPGSPCPWTMKNDGHTCLSGPASTTAVTTIPSNGKICPGPDATSSYRGNYPHHYLINGCYGSTAGSTTTVCTGSSCSCSSYADSCSCSGSGKNKTCKQNTYDHPWVANNHNTWSGCVADRTQDYDTKNTAPAPGTTDSLFPAEQYYENSESYCATNNNPPLQQVTPLSYAWSTIKSNIDAMQPTGGTNQPIGLAQAWQTLAQSDPYDAPVEDSTYTYKKAIILLSDGLNTENRWPSYGDGSTQSGTKIDDRQKILCDNIKATGITIYTIQVNTSKPADPTSSVLQYCASGADNFYLVTSASQTLSVFNSIGASLSQLRVAR